jgi:putative iron-only hydrogenase system regulator
MEKRVGFVGIIIGDRKKNSDSVNAILSEFGDIVVARTGIPNVRDQFAVIMLVVDATSDRVGALTGKLGALPGVSVKSMLSKQE